jgi:hypothetical protein
MDIDKLVERRNQLVEYRKQWEDWSRECIDDLIKSEETLRHAGLPNAALEENVKKAQKRFENVDQARRSIDEHLSHVITVLLSLNH